MQVKQLTVPVKDGDGNITTTTYDLAATYDGDGNVITSRYETKADADSKHTAINNAIAGIVQFSYKVVASLPSTGDNGTIYLVADKHSDSNDAYDEYLWVGSAWEKIGNTDVNLTGFYTKDEVDQKIPTALKNPNKLSFGSKSYDGSSAQTIALSDLGLTMTDVDVTYAG